MLLVDQHHRLDLAQSLLAFNNPLEPVIGSGTVANPSESA
jgi:hypothetical protein